MTLFQRANVIVQAYPWFPGEPDRSAFSTTQYGEWHDSYCSDRLSWHSYASLLFSRLLVAL